MPGGSASETYAHLMPFGSDVEQRTFFRRVLTVALVAVVLALAWWLMGEIGNVIFMVFVALFVAVAFEPPVHYLAKRGWRRGPATGLVLLVTVILAGLFIALLVPLFVDQVQLLIDSIPGIVEALADLLERIGFDLSDVDIDDIGSQIVSAIQSVGPAIVGGVIGLTASVVGFLFFATTVALFAFYMIAELPQLQRTVLSTMPEARQRRALHVWDVAVEKMGGYIYSRLILATISATVSSIFLYLLDVPFAVTLGIFVGIFSQFVPVVGTYIAAILPALVALTFNDFWTAVWTVVWFTAYQQIENYVISPRITKRTMEIHPAVSVGAIIIGGNLMGAIGILLALPMTGIIQAIISEYRKSYDVILDEDAAAEEETADLSDA